MGSTGYMIGSDWSWNGNTRQYLDKQLNGSYQTTKWTVLASETKGSCYYAAVEQLNIATGDRYVFAVVMPYSFYGKGYNRELIVKDQDESMGPYHCDASAKILNLLTPTDSKYANRWRDDCRKNLEKEKSAPKMEVGDVLIFEEPLSFGHWGHFDTFVVTQVGRSKRFRAIVDGHKGPEVRLRRNTLKYRTHIIEKGLTPEK